MSLKSPKPEESRRSLLGDAPVASSEGDLESANDIQSVSNEKPSEPEPGKSHLAEYLWVASLILVCLL